MLIQAPSMEDQPQEEKKKIIKSKKCPHKM